MVIKKEGANIIRETFHEVLQYIVKFSLCVCGGVLDTWLEMCGFVQQMHA